MLAVCLPNQVYRELIGLAGNDEVKLELYKTACGLLCDLHQQDAVPALEISWLTATCWNRGCTLAKFRKNAEAEKFMRLALDLQTHCPGLQSRRADMEKELQQVPHTIACLILHTLV